MNDTCPRCGTEIDPTKYGHVCRNPEPPAPITREELQKEIADAIFNTLIKHEIILAHNPNFYEPCANVDGGINILKSGEKIWESAFSDLGDIVNGKYANESRWQEALRLCSALNFCDMDIK